MRQDIEHGGALGDFDRMVELRYADHDSVADANPLRDHRAGGEEKFRRGAVRILFEEVMLDGEHRIVTKLIGEFHLLKASIVNGRFDLAGPGTRD